jgi:tetratricopeptide (TPR) repeat protein
MGLLVAAVSAAASAQNSDTKISLDSSESLFTVLAAMNACGYDAELQASNPLRSAIRAEVAANLAQAEAVQRELCAFYRDHQQPDGAHELAQYVSLGLLLGPPPRFELAMKETDLPPGASYVAGLLPLLQSFYERAGIHAIWEKHRQEYQGLLDQYHQQVAQTILSTDAYLRMPVGSYHSKHMAMFLEPLASPGQVNARNYGSDYFLVLSPDAGGRIRLEAVRHLYLHYLLDSMLQNRPVAMRRLEAILPALMSAPMDDAYKRDIALLVTESLIRAIEARMQAASAGEDARNRVIESAVGDGFVLARTFYAGLIQFEKGPSGFQHFLPDLLAETNAEQERKRADQVTFNAQATPDVLSASVRRSAPQVSPQAQLLDQAEARLTAGDAVTAQKLAQQALENKRGDQAWALFILAKAALLGKQEPEKRVTTAQEYFQRAIEVGQNPRVVAWSHVYLGRIFDMKDEREEALKHYNAALNSGFDGEKMKSAAQSGMKEPYRGAEGGDPNGEKKTEKKSDPQ